MLVIGAGEAGRLVVEVARKRGISQMVIASRTKERAQALATELHGTPIDLSNLSDELRSVDIVVACAGAPHWILNVSHMEEVMRKRSDLTLVLVDIALPRNVEPEVGRIRNVFLYNMDDLNEISNLNRKQREAEVSHAEEIITSEVDKFVTWLQDFEVRPIVSALMSKAEKIRSTKLNKTLKKLRPLSDDERDSLEAMTKSIVTRILKDPVEYLKADGNSNHSQMVRELFQLNTDEHSKG
jgi:glutamyl-tRNA reductase